MSTLYAAVKDFLRRTDGPTTVEYGVMLALIVVVCISTISTLGLQTKQVCDTICTYVWGT
jgi:pilus assembly protein Flp/PilA